MKKRILSFVLMLLTIASVMPFGALADNDAAGFKDVVAGSYYAKPVAWAVKNDITKGTSATTFSPNADCTRAQVVTFLWRAEGCPEPESSESPFVDVKNKDGMTHYYSAILWAAENGITTGVDEKHFKPDASVTRCQFVTFLWRTAGKPESTKATPFTDVKSGTFYAKAVSWAVENGITNGYTATSFAPNANCTRAQVVTFLYRWKVGEVVEMPCVCIDAGHQKKQNSDVEPIGPGASEKKMKCSFGAVGNWTNIPEYELNLAVSLKLQKILEARGYSVVMTRTTNDVDLSNIDRAKIAENAGADILVRIHANSFDSSSANGALTMCMTKNNPYNSQLYTRSRALSEYILNNLVSRTGCYKRSILEQDDMCGINWATMPVTIVEMGFMSNEKEDKLMATDAYREKLALGIADGIDEYFAHYPA